MPGIVELTCKTAVPDPKTNEGWTVAFRFGEDGEAKSNTGLAKPSIEPMEIDEVASVLSPTESSVELALREKSPLTMMEMKRCRTTVPKVPVMFIASK